MRALTPRYEGHQPEYFKACAGLRSAIKLTNLRGEILTLTRVGAHTSDSSNSGNSLYSHVYFSNTIKLAALLLVTDWPPTLQDVHSRVLNQSARTACSQTFYCAVLNTVLAHLAKLFTPAGQKAITMSGCKPGSKNRNRCTQTSNLACTDLLLNPDCTPKTKLLWTTLRVKLTHRKSGCE